MNGFEVEFKYDTTLEIDGVVNVYEGTIYLTAYRNGSWNLDHIDGEIIEDPENATETLNLSEYVNTRKAFMKYLLADDSFNEFADQMVREEIMYGV